MSEEKKVPKIRFPGFEEEWEERKLGDLGNFKNGMNFSKEAMGKGYPFVNLQNIFGLNIIDTDNLGLAEANDAQRREYNLQEGDVLFVRSSVKLEGVGEAALVPKNLENTTYSGFVIRFRDEVGMDNDFKRFIFGTKHIRDQIMAKATNSANKNISQEVLNSLGISLPLKSEQQKIGSFFSRVDDLIDFHQCECDKWKELKKSLLQKMFPKEGDSVPEIRFPGFTESWAQRKIGEVSKRVIVGLATSVTPFYREKGVPILRNLNIKENYLDDSDVLYLEQSYAESQVSKQIHTGDVLTVHTGYIGISCIVPEKYNNCLTFTTLITTTDPTIIQGEFLVQYLNSEMGISAVQAVTTQGGRQNLNTNDFIKVEIRYPSLAEQYEICNVLSNIDNLIILYQRELNKWKTLKKGLLQQMFVA